MKLKILKKDELKKNIAVIVGTRPGIIKFAPVIRRLQKRGVPHFIIHTGQHYSYNMDKSFFEDLKLPEPKHTLATVRECKYHGEQTAEMLKGIEKVLISEKPAITIVGGDANTNLSGALAARKLGITLAHMEAGLRSGDWAMPEEHNRVMIDHISELLFPPTELAKQNLLRDNVDGEIFVTGNPIVDSVKDHLKIAQEKSKILERLEIKPREFFIVTLHREENVDSKDKIEKFCITMKELNDYFYTDIIFPIHPRTIDRLNYFDCLDNLERIERLQLIEAVGYLDFLKLLYNSSLVLTDSGGIQEEACVLQVPCVTLRENTERPETVEVGANIVASTQEKKVLKAARYFLEEDLTRNWDNPFGNDCSRKIVDRLAQKLDEI